MRHQKTHLREQVGKLEELVFSDIVVGPEEEAMAVAAYLEFPREATELLTSSGLTVDLVFRAPAACWILHVINGRPYSPTEDEAEKTWGLWQAVEHATFVDAPHAMATLRRVVRARASIWLVVVLYQLLNLLIRRKISPQAALKTLMRLAAAASDEESGS